MGLFNVFKRNSNLKNVVAKIEQAAAIFESNPSKKSDEIIDMLIKKLGNEAIAIDLFRFLPIAYCRMMIRDVNFPNAYMIRESDGSHSEHKLMDNALYVEVDRFVIRKFIGQVSQENIMSVLNYSAEFQAINTALYNGSKLEDLVLAPPVFT